MAAKRDDDHLDTDLDVGDLFPILTEFRNRQAGALSGGQQQQLAIARALCRGRGSCCSTSRASASRPRWSRTSGARCG